VSLLLLQTSILRDAVPEDVQQAEAAGIVLVVSIHNRLLQQQQQQQCSAVSDACGVAAPALHQQLARHLLWLLGSWAWAVGLLHSAAALFRVTKKVWTC
jgi:hypothetical protein